MSAIRRTRGACTRAPDGAAQQRMSDSGLEHQQAAKHTTAEGGKRPEERRQRYRQRLDLGRANAPTLVM